MSLPINSLNEMKKEKNVTSGLTFSTKSDTKTQIKQRSLVCTRTFVEKKKNKSKKETLLQKISLHRTLTEHLIANERKFVK